MATSATGAGGGGGATPGAPTPEEVRSDKLRVASPAVSADDAAQLAWAARLAPLLTAAARDLPG